MSFTIRNLVFCYPGATAPALEVAQLDFPEGKVIGLLGPSGSGKTTLLFMLGLLWDGLCRVGEIVYRGRVGTVDYALITSSGQVALRLEEFGFVLQTCYLLPHFSCFQNIALPLALQGWARKEREARVADLLNRAGDEELLKASRRHGSEVSLGQRQRVAVLRSIVHDPNVVFADEPTSNLDERNTQCMIDLLRQWRGGELGDATGVNSAHPRTLILVCHHLETALRHADWLVILNSDHKVEATFDYKDWVHYASAVNKVLGTNVPSEFDPAHRLRS